MLIQDTTMKMIRGDSESFTVSVELDTGEDYALEDGDTIYFTVKQNATSSKNELQKIVKSFPDGVAVIEILPEDTKHMRFISYVYDIQLTTKNGEVKTLVPHSRFTVGEEVTHE